MDRDLPEALSDALGEAVRDLRRLSAGASRDTWSFAMPDGSKRIVQRLPRGASRAGVDLEAAVLRAAFEAGVPVARVFASFDAGGPLGMPALVLERVEGEALPPLLRRDARFAPALDALAGECGRILARLHSIPLDRLPSLSKPDPIERCREVLDSLQERHPAFELVLRRLELSRPEPRPDTLVHGDFRLGNLLVGEAGVTAVLDWELVHRGDPVEDLGWLCVPAWRFGGELPVAGVGRYEQLLDAYRSAGGAELTVEELRWWQAAGTVWWGVLCHVQASRHLGGQTRSVELASIGRRACEQEWDALAVLPELAGRLTRAPEVASPDGERGPA
jgi:aminoglycoside phosphotransferase (APT) family kinase protein